MTVSLITFPLPFAAPAATLPTMSEFKFSCPHCAQHLQGDERLGGKQIQCPACKHLIVIPPSPSQQAGEKFTPESGHTWATYIPRAPKPPVPEQPEG